MKGLAPMASVHRTLEIETEDGFSIHNLTEELREVVRESGIQEGMVVVTSLHTTLALSVNENEARLLDDIRATFLRLVPPDAAYRHNDIALRDCPPDEPENAHAHLIAMMLGNSETLAVHRGRPLLGRWQSLLAVELDGPRRRRLAVQILGD